MQVKSWDVKILSCSQPMDNDVPLRLPSGPNPCFRLRFHRDVVPSRAYRSSRGCLLHITTLHTCAVVCRNMLASRITLVTLVTIVRTRIVAVEHRPRPKTELFRHMQNDDSVHSGRTPSCDQICTLPVNTKFKIDIAVVAQVTKSSLQSPIP